jgi:nitroreductase
MNVIDAINARRAYRSLDPVEITGEMIKDLADCARLSASCFNHQPWRYVFVKGLEALAQLKTALNKGNEWAHFASMIIAVYTRKENDCIIKNREYALFDTGMSAACLILRATELGLVAHPIAGYDEQKAKLILNIPDDHTLITLIIVGRKRQELRPELADHQKLAEPTRPPRLEFDQVASVDRVAQGQSSSVKSS